MRETLERDPWLGRRHDVDDEMRAKDLTDYVAWPLSVRSHAGELILAGATRRGSGTKVRAAIMICDLVILPASPITGLATASSSF